MPEAPLVIRVDELERRAEALEYERDCLREALEQKCRQYDEMYRAALSQAERADILARLIGQSYGGRN